MVYISRMRKEFDTLHLHAHGLHTRDEGVTRDRPVARRREGERKRIRTVNPSGLRQELVLTHISHQRPWSTHKG
ncbi:hypothetical protein RRG08_066452 [Elysia crispata]|uniref:Uncharacterized protein n=1 Tax=Elysia crispata TaxID=231223 RepID=A0AAE0ZLF4_9GAST|nr:hypothetical protein RRG08_066452 [Elysia crispata]